MYPTLKFNYRIDNSGNNSSYRDNCWVTYDRIATGGDERYRSDKDENRSHYSMGRLLVKMNGPYENANIAIEATARKMIAAYEMYAALKECLQYLPSASPARKLVEAALFKADNEEIPQ